MGVLRSVWRILRLFVKTVMVIVLTVVLVPPAVVGVALGIAVFSPTPVAIPKAKQFKPLQASHVYDVYGNELAVFKDFESNIPIAKADVPIVLKQAVISAEDRNFYAHGGVDIKGTIRALVADAKQGEAKQGGSTITQQYVKNVYENNDAVDAANKTGASADATLAGAAVKGGSGKRDLTRKLREAILATRLNRKISKEDILYGYLTTIYLGEGAFGVEAASQTYFRKSAKHLTLSEAATLAGLIPAPTLYEPRGHTRSAEVKRLAVLRAMREEGYISRSQELRTAEQYLWSERQGPPPIGQPVTLVFGRKRVESKYPYFVDYVRRYLEARYGVEKVRTGGLQVQTTIDPKLQALAEASVAKTLKGTKAPLEMALVSVEPLTGFVRAMVGGREYDAPDGQVNLALGACPTVANLEKRLKHKPAVPPICDGSTFGGGSGRSPGSSIKPIVLAAAMAEGISPRTVYDGSRFKPKCAGRAIRNYEGGGSGPADLRTATIKSINTIYARLGMDVGIDNVAKMAQKLGIQSAWYDPKVHCASWSLGGIDVSPLEMASAYAVFAGRGLKATFPVQYREKGFEPVAIDEPATPVVRVIDGAGNLLEDNTGNHTTRVLAENVADNVSDILQAVVTSGTAKRAQLGDRPVAGKTGTSQGAGNVWFVGYTPTISTAIWMGYRDSPRPLRNIKGVRSVIGGTFPAITWKDYMAKATADVPPTGFTAPAPIRRVVVVSRVLQLRKRERKGIDVGAKSAIGKTRVSSYLTGLAPFAVERPPYIAPPSTVAPPPTLPPPASAPPPTLVPPEPVTEPPPTIPPATSPPATNAPTVAPTAPVVLSAPATVAPTAPPVSVAAGVPVTVVATTNPNSVVVVVGVPVVSVAPNPGVPGSVVATNATAPATTATTRA